MLNTIENALNKVRKEKPLILNLTNFVTMDFIANCLLALGAVPIMSVCEEELEELVNLSSAIYVNLGTLDDFFINLSKKAIYLASRHDKPIILDPVGAGATKIRTQTAQDIAFSSTIVRGNASEIMALGEQVYTTKGVESTHTPEDTKSIAINLARQYKNIIAVSGPVDFITDGARTSQIIHGSNLMPLVTGMGCAVTAVIAAFLAVLDDPFVASDIGVHYFSLCGEMTALTYTMPGTFKSAFIDQLYMADFTGMKNLCSMKTK